MNVNWLLISYIFFVSTIDEILSEIPITDQVYFYHYSDKYQLRGRELKTEEELDPKINLTLPWKFFIHGFTTDPVVSPWFHTGKAAYFLKGDYNVVFVDWSKPANQTYFQSMENASGSGKFLANFLKHLNATGVPHVNIHLLGHSLGSHMAGFAGKHYKNITGQKLGRITGLDPAGPFYELNPLLPQIKYLKPDKLRLSKDDANFVDIIHTDGNYYGMVSSIGHVDFFPNGGKAMQPGCESTNDINCSHARSTHFFIESILNNTFVGRECENFENYKKGLCNHKQKAFMGEHADHNIKGNFYLTTNSQRPFGKGDDDTVIKRNCSTKQKLVKVETFILIFIVLLLFYK